MPGRNPLVPLSHVRSYENCRVSSVAAFTSYTPRNGRALSAVMGASAKRAHRLQERRSSVMTLVFCGGRWWRCPVLEFAHPAPSGTALFHREVGGHGKQRRDRLRALDVRQRGSGFAAPRIAPLAHDHHLQIVGGPRLVHDEDRLLISDLAGRNRARQARSLCANSANHLGAQIFLFQIAGSDFFLLAGLPFLLELAAFHQAFHSAMRMAHLFRHFGIGMQHEIRLRHWIVNHYERFRLAGSCQRTKSRERYFLANAPLAVAEDIRLRLSGDVITVRDRFPGLSHRDSAERRARHHFAAVHSLEAQQFDTVAHRRRHEVAAGPASVHDVSVRRWRRWRFLRSRQPGAHYQRAAKNQAHDQSAIHCSFSSSLPNSQNFFVPLYCCGSLTACGNPSFPTRRSTWIHSPARSSFTGRPSAPSELRCMRTRKIAASAVSAGKVPGNSVKSFNSLSAISVSDSAASGCWTATAPCNSAPVLGTEFVLFPAEFVTLGVDFKWFAISFELSLRQFIQLTAPTNTAAAASAHAAITAVRRTFNVTCRVRNSWRKRISTRAGACAMAVSSANARSSTPAACQESCNAAQREQGLACSRAAARSASLNEESRSASNPIASNSSHVISCFLCITQKPSTGHNRPPPRPAKQFPPCHPQNPAPTRKRTARGAPGWVSFFLGPRIKLINTSCKFSAAAQLFPVIRRAKRYMAAWCRR